MAAFSRIPRIASPRLFAATATLALLLTTGCKSKDSGGSLTKNDPLIGGPSRIPKQNVPVPGGTASGPKNRTDPLLGSPTSGTRANAGIGFTDDPQRWKGGPYVPGPGAAPAALAGKIKEDGEELKIDSPKGVGLTPAAGSIPAAPPPGSDATATELAKLNIKRGDYTVTREGNQFLVRVNVLLSPQGPTRALVGQGLTEAAAVKQVVEQIKNAK